MCNPTTPPTLNSSSEIGSSKCPIFVPAASIPDYAAASNWSTYASRLAPLEDHEDGGYVPFADSAVLAICVANWDTNGSGYMSKNECAAVTSIGTKFKGNTEIASFNEFENFTGIKTWDNYAFMGCNNLTSIKLPNNLPAIPVGLFANCTSLMSIDIPESVTAINREAFWTCGGLISIVVRNPTPITLVSGALTGVTASIYVPDDSVDAYKAASGWSSFASRIKPLSEYTE